MNRQLNPWVLIGLLLAEVPLVIWGGASVFVFAVSTNVPPGIAWVPSVALGGVMLASTVLSMQPGVDQAIRMYAGGLAAVAILGEVIVAGGQHYVAAKAPPGQAVEFMNPDPAWGFLIGGLPSLMGGALVHLTAMYFKQLRKEKERLEELKRREKEELDAAKADLSTAAGVRAAAAAEYAEADRLRRAQRDEDVKAATAVRQAVQQERDEAARLKAEVVRLREDIERENEALEQARKEQERLRSRERRRRDKATAQRPLSQPVARDTATVSQTVSQPVSQPASRAERREWARKQIESGEWVSVHGRELTGADIDKHFGPPRTGAAILREVRAEFDGELRAIASGKAGGAR